MFTRFEIRLLPCGQEAALPVRIAEYWHGCQHHFCYLLTDAKQLGIHEVESGAESERYCSGSVTKHEEANSQIQGGYQVRRPRNMTRYTMCIHSTGSGLMKSKSGNLQSKDMTLNMMMLGVIVDKCYSYISIPCRDVYSNKSGRFCFHVDQQLPWRPKQVICHWLRSENPREEK